MLQLEATLVLVQGTLFHIGTLFQAVLKLEVHLDVLGPATLEEVSVDVYGPCYH